MTRSSLGVITGLFVFAMGAVTVISLVGPNVETSVGVAATTSTRVDSTATEFSIASTTFSQLPGVADNVAEVLRSSGHSTLATTEELDQIPQNIAAVLIDRGVPLRLPEPNGGEGH